MLFVPWGNRTNWLMLCVILVIDYPLSFSRYIGVMNPNQSLDLNGEYFLLFGRGPRGGREIRSSFQSR